MSRFQFSRFYYFPIVLVILAGYAVGFLGWYRCALKPEVVELNDIEMFGSLFSLGLAGGAMAVSKFFGADVAKNMYSAEQLPSWLDPFGYALQVIGAGFTGVFFYLVVKLGIGVAVDGMGNANISTQAAWVLAFAGGFATNSIKDFMLDLVKSKVPGSGETKETMEKAKELIQKVNDFLPKNDLDSADKIMAQLHTVEDSLPAEMRAQVESLKQKIASLRAGT